MLPSGRHVVNDGSVGKPKDGDPRACYAVLEVAGGSPLSSSVPYAFRGVQGGRKLSVTFVRVAYDIERTARAIEASDMPHEFARMLRTGAG